MSGEELFNARQLLPVVLFITALKFVLSRCEIALLAQHVVDFCIAGIPTESSRQVFE